MQDRWARLWGEIWTIQLLYKVRWMLYLSLCYISERHLPLHEVILKQNVLLNCTWMGCQHKWTPLHPPQEVQLQVAWSFSPLTMRANGVFCRLRRADTNNLILLSQRPTRRSLCLLSCFPSSWSPNSSFSPVMMWLWDAEGCNYVLSDSGGQRVQ